MKFCIRHFGSIRTKLALFPDIEIPCTLRSYGCPAGTIRWDLSIAINATSCNSRPCVNFIFACVICIASNAVELPFHVSDRIGVTVVIEICSGWNKLLSFLIWTAILWIVILKKNCSSYNQRASNDKREVNQVFEKSWGCSPFKTSASRVVGTRSMSVHL